MPSPRQNREYLHDVVLPHLREMYDRQAKKMLRVFGTEYESPDDLITHHKDEGDDITPALLDFSMYTHIYERNCNIINDEYNCGRTGCFAGWYVMMSEQQRRFIPWDPSWKAVKEFSTRDLARHFGITTMEAGNLFGSTGEGIEYQELSGDSFGYDSEVDQCQVEFTQGDILEIRADYLRGLMG